MKLFSWFQFFKFLYLFVVKVENITKIDKSISIFQYASYLVFFDTLFSFSNAIYMVITRQVLSENDRFSLKLYIQASMRKKFYVSNVSLELRLFDAQEDVSAL